MSLGCAADAGVTEGDIYKLCTPRRFSVVLTTRRHAPLRASQSAIAASLTAPETALTRALEPFAAFTEPAGDLA